MTDPSGNMVWQADYLPFGEENLTSGTLENDFRFVGKENDKETGLYYFGARYMEAMIGRFISPDPVGAVSPTKGRVDQTSLLNAQRLNRYSYSLNNPNKYIDPDGKWPYWIHQEHITIAFRGVLPQHDINILRNQQPIMDRPGILGGTYTDPNMHALAKQVAGQWQTPAQGWEGANSFVRSEVTLARQLEERGRHDEALIHLGNAIHTMQDTISPPHEGYQHDPSVVDYRSHYQREK
jgi:RHS repeat-associated protein